MRKFVIVVLMTFLTFGSADAQLGKLGSKLKKGLNALTEEVQKSSSSESQNYDSNSAKSKLKDALTPKSKGFEKFTPAKIPSNA